MKKRFSKFTKPPIISVLLFNFVFAIGLPAQDQRRFTIRSNATMVTSDVTVIGPDVANLAASDFVVYDNGVAHEVTHFSRNELPLAIGFLIDTSLTVQPYLPLIQVAAGTALRRLAAEDMVVLYSFDNYPERHSKLVNDRIEIARKISKLNFELGTNIYETVSDAAKYLQKNAPHHRRAIIMISDNYHIVVPSNYQYRPFIGGQQMPVDQEEEEKQAEEARVRALEGAVTIFSIKTPSTTNIDTTGSLPRVRRIVNDTGGEILDIRGWASLQSAMEETLEKLRKQYTIGFNPSELGEDGSFHTLEVKFADENRCADCRILARTGYYAGSSSPVPEKEKKKKKLKYTQEEMDQLLIQQSIATAGTYTYTSGPFGNSVEDIVKNMNFSRLSDINLDVKPERIEDAKGKEMLKLNLKIDAGRIHFRKIEDRYACKLHIGVFYFNEYMRRLGSEVQILEGQLKEDTYKQVMQSGILYPVQLPLKVKKQYTNVVVYDGNSDRAGSRFVLPLPED